MQLTKVMNTNMEVAIMDGMMIGKCRGPVKAILKKDESRLEAILNTIKLDEEMIEETVEKAAIETNVVDLYEGIDMDDYKLFCNWMIANGGEPSIEEYKQAMEYYSSL